LDSGFKYKPETKCQNEMEVSRFSQMKCVKLRGEIPDSSLCLMSEELFIMNMLFLNSQPGSLSSGFGTCAGAVAEQLNFSS
jgi:hypothetical protein